MLSLTHLEQDITLMMLGGDGGVGVRGPGPEPDLLEATILLYSPALDPPPAEDDRARRRVFCLYEMERAPVKGRAKAMAKMPRDQGTLAYS
jgi:hypothetical protein